MLPVIKLTRAELEALPECSATVPTGATPARWRRNLWAFRPGRFEFEICGLEFSFPYAITAVWVTGEFVGASGGYRSLLWKWVEVVS